MPADEDLGMSGERAMVQRPKWSRRAEAELSRESLAALLVDEIPAIRIRNFASHAECAAFAAAVRRAGLRYYSVARRIGYIGMAQYEYRWNRPKEDYFRDVPAADEKREAVQRESFDAMHRLVDRLAEHYDAGRVGIAAETLGSYYAGIIRQASEGVDLHADFAPFNSPTYVIGTVDAQLGWNFYAEALVAGGETTVHHAPWTPEIKAGEIPQSYDLPRETVAGAETFTFTPDLGDVVIFNTRNPHEIAGGQSAPGRERISIGSFIGRLPNRDLVMWS
jgi:hypothetical protein